MCQIRYVSLYQRQSIIADKLMVFVFPSTKYAAKVSHRLFYFYYSLWRKRAAIGGEEKLNFLEDSGCFSWGGKKGAKKVFVGNAKEARVWRRWCKAAITCRIPRKNVCNVCTYNKWFTLTFVLSSQRVPLTRKEKNCWNCWALNELRRTCNERHFHLTISEENCSICHFPYSFH